jgi:hypothetical protein
MVVDLRYALKVLATSFRNQAQMNGEPSAWIGLIRISAGPASAACPTNCFAHFVVDIRDNSAGDTAALLMTLTVSSTLPDGEQ